MKAGIMGFAVGDALGVPVEFLNRDLLQRRPLKEMIGYGSRRVPEGTWSDDTSLMIASMDSIKENGDVNFDDIKRHPFFKGFSWERIKSIRDIAVLSYLKKKVAQTNKEIKESSIHHKETNIIIIDTNDENNNQYDRVTGCFYCERVDNLYEKSRDVINVKIKKKELGINEDNTVSLLEDLK